MKKKLIAFLTASTMLFTMSISAYAAQYEFTHKNGTKTTPGEVIAQGKAGEILAQKQDYKIELKDGKQYNLADYLVALKDNPTFTEDQIIEKLNENAAEELKVVSVSAINKNAALSGETVKPNEKFKIAFSEALDGKTVTNANVSVKKKGTLAVPVTVTLSEDKKSVLVSPNLPLEVKEDFVLVVSKAVMSEDGKKALPADHTVEFKTEDAVVVTAFKVGTKTLEDGGFEPSDLTSTGITLVANKDLDANTVNTSTVKLYNVTDKKFVPAFLVTYMPASKKITFVASDAEMNKVYELRLEGVKALDNTTADGYVQQFTVGLGITPMLSVTEDYDAGTNDKTYGGLTAVMVKMATDTDANNDADRLLSPFKVTLNFSGRAMDVSTLIPENVKLVETDDAYEEKENGTVEGTMAYDANTFMAVFTPKQALKDDAYYKFTTTNRIKDANGVAAEEATALKFHTGDFTMPSVVSTTVDSGAKLKKNEKLKITFSEKMQRLVAAGGPGFKDIDNQHSVTLHDDSAANSFKQVDIAIDAADTTGKTYTFIKNGGWDLNKTYTLKIKGKNYSKLLSASDVAGNPMAADYTITFTTADATVPEVTAVKGFAKGFTGTEPNVDLLGSSANKPVVGLNEAETAAATASKEAIHFHFNRVMDGGFTNITSYEFSDNGGLTFAPLAAPTANVPGWAVAAKADENGKNTIVTLTPTQSTTTSNDAGNVIAGEKKFAIKLKKGTTTADNKKLAEDVVVYFNTEEAKPALAAANALQTYNAATGGSLADVSASTESAWINRGLAIKFTENVKVDTLNGENIKIEDVTAGKTLVGAFYEDITGADVQTLLPTTPGAVSADETVYWYPAGEDNSFINGHKYKVTINNIQDKVGNLMSAPYIEYFTLKDTDELEIASTSVTNGQEGVSIEPALTVTFNKEVTNASSEIKLKKESTNIKVAIDFDKKTKTATITPLVYLEPLTQYVLLVPNDITDGSLTLGMDKEITFTTEDVKKKAKITSAVLETKSDGSKTLVLEFDKPIKSGQSITLAADQTSSFLMTSGASTWGTNPAAIISLSDRKKVTIHMASDSTIQSGMGLFIVKNVLNLEDGSDFAQTEAWNSNLSTTQNATITSGHYIEIR